MSHPNDPLITDILETAAKPGHKPIRSATVGDTTIDVLAETVLPHPLNGGHNNGGFKEKIVVFRTTENSKFDPVLFEEGCQHLESGKSLYEFCRSRGLSAGQFFKWVEIDADARDRFARAQSAQGKHLMQRAGEVAQDLVCHKVVESWIPEGREKIGNAVINAVVNGAKLMIDVAKRLCPHLYGDRIEVKRDEHSISYVVSFNSDKQDRSEAQPGQAKRVKGTTVDLPPGTLQARQIGGRLEGVAKRSRGGKTKSTPPSKVDSST